MFGPAGQDFFDTHLKKFHQPPSWVDDPNAPPSASDSLSHHGGGDVSARGHSYSTDGGPTSDVQEHSQQRSYFGCGTNRIGEQSEQGPPTSKGRGAPLRWSASEASTRSSEGRQQFRVDSSGEASCPSQGSSACDPPAGIVHLGSGSDPARPCSLSSAGQLSYLRTGDLQQPALIPARRGLSADSQGAHAQAPPPPPPYVPPPSQHGAPFGVAPSAASRSGAGHGVRNAPPPPPGRSGSSSAGARGSSSKRRSSSSGPNQRRGPGGGAQQHHSHQPLRADDHVAVFEVEHQTENEAVAKHSCSRQLSGLRAVEELRCCRCQRTANSYFDHKCNTCQSIMCVDCLEDFRQILHSYRCPRCGEEQQNQEALRQEIWMLNIHRSTQRAFNMIGESLSGWFAFAGADGATRSCHAPPLQRTRSQGHGGDHPTNMDEMEDASDVEETIADHSSRSPGNWYGSGNGRATPAMSPDRERNTYNPAVLPDDRATRNTYAPPPPPPDARRGISRDQPW